MATMQAHHMQLQYQCSTEYYITAELEWYQELFSAMGTCEL